MFYPDAARQTVFAIRRSRAYKYLHEGERVRIATSFFNWLRQQQIFIESRGRGGRPGLFGCDCGPSPRQGHRILLSEFRDPGLSVVSGRIGTLAKCCRPGGCGFSDLCPGTERAREGDHGERLSLPRTEGNTAVYRAGTKVGVTEGRFFGALVCGIPLQKDNRGTLILHARGADRTHVEPD